METPDTDDRQRRALIRSHGHECRELPDGNCQHEFTVTSYDPMRRPTAIQYLPHCIKCGAPNPDA